jgi:hypothetical protein
MQESDFVKGLTDDSTPLTKAILSYAQGHATGYQQVCNDNIVISRQDYDLLKVQPDCEFCEGFLCRQTEKLTAEKILNDLWKERNAIGQLMIFEEHLKEKAKEFGVEIKE